MDLSNYSFEDAISRLDELTALLSSPTVTLADSVALFREAAELRAHCAKLLQEASLQIEQIEKDAGQ